MGRDRPMTPFEAILAVGLSVEAGDKITEEEFLTLVEKPPVEWPESLKEKLKKARVPWPGWVELEARAVKEVSEDPLLRIPLLTSKDEARKYIPNLTKHIQDTDLKRLKWEYRSDFEEVLITMLTNPRERWEELGIPSYMMKYRLGD